MPKGEVLNKILEKGEKFTKRYKEEQITFKEYESWFTASKGGLYEHDGYTDLIIETLKYIKESGYKTALIIEDLDRIDPAHLFRILNVLGAHIDEHIYKDSENTNKFGFDNIITVFDYNITEHIFHHFYGKNANYKGYINKFTSHQPFYYSIDEIAREYLYKVISEKCCIEKESIRNISQQIKNKLDSLSVRDVNNILDGIDLYIVNEQYNANLVIFNTKSPLTYTISILKLLGISTLDIKSYIFNLSPIELLNCINVFLFIITEDNFIFKNLLFKINYDKKFRSSNQIIDKISVTEQHEGLYPIILNEKSINDCFNTALKFIIK